MANSLFLSGRSVGTRLISNIYKNPVFLNPQSCRHLYDKASLGVDTFLQQREQMRNQMETILPKFKEKMSAYTEEGAQSMIFTEDLKNMIYLANDDQDMEIMVKMLKKFNGQNKQLRFGSFIFGPVVMRLLHHHNKPDLALECFNSPELDGLFDQLISYQILLDLLYENQRYEDILTTFERIISRQASDMKYPKNIVVLAMAACYKLNDAKSLDFALKLWNDLLNVGHIPMRRAATFCATLALNHGKPEIALEVISTVRNASYTTVRNIKVAALSAVGRVDDALPILKSVLADDHPENVVHTFNRDIFEKIKQAVLEADNPDISVEFNKLEKIFEQQGHFTTRTLDEQLCEEIKKPAMLNNRQENRFSRFNDRNRSNKYSKYQQNRRPGLRDFV